MSKHTPGDWQVMPDDIFGIKCVGILSDQDEWIAHVETWCDDEPATVERAKANARLIAASPKLKEALEGMLRICQGDSGTGESYWQTVPEYVAARAALAATEEG